MSTLKLIQIPKPDYHRLVIGRRTDEVDSLGPLTVGSGDVDLVCGSCEAVLARGVENGWSIRMTVYRCHDCRAYNEAPR